MGITGIHSEHASYINAYINRAGLACLLKYGLGVVMEGVSPKEQQEVLIGKS